MAAFKTVQEFIYEKPPLDTISDMEKAFEKIGKVIKVDREAGNITGKTKYGLNSVTINAEVSDLDGKTKIIFHGKSGDAAAIGAQNGIAKLIASMPYSNVNEIETQEERAPTGKLVLMWVFAALGGIIGIFLASSIIGAKYPNGTPKYIKSHRTQATVALTVAICLTTVYLISAWS